MPKPDVARLLAAFVESGVLVRVGRTPRNADVVEGYVVGVGSKWVLLAQIADGGYLDGFVAIRVRDVESVELKQNSFEAEFSRTQAGWPPRSPEGIDLDKTSALISGLGADSPLVGIEQEHRIKAPMQWIGIVDDISDGWLWLHEVRPDASWNAAPLGYKLSRITKVEVGNRYKVALAASAEPWPREGVEPAGRLPGSRVALPWFSVRSVYRFKKRFDGRDVYEERVVLFEAPDAEAAIAKAEVEAARYIEDLPGGEVLSLFQSFWMFEPPGDGAEVFSLNRVNDLDSESYLDHFFSTGEERQLRL